MAKIFKNPFKNPKLKAFFFFLLLASVFWVLTKFSKQDTATFNSSISYRNAPQGNVFSDKNSKTISYTVSANKFELLYLYLKSPTIHIDLASMNKATSQNVVLSETELSALLQKQIRSSAVIKNTSPKQLEIIMDVVNFKKIPVQLIADITYKNGFQKVEEIQIVPDSVTVTGAKKYIDAMQTIKTETLTLNEVEDVVTTKLRLKALDTSMMVIKPKNVSVTIKVEEFSQKEITVPITIINSPEDGTIKLLPKEIKLTFNAPVSLFNDISVSDFKIVCDYKNRNKEDNFMVPEITEMPKGIIDLEMETKKIDILLFK